MYWYVVDGVVLIEVVEYEFDVDVILYCIVFWGDFLIWFDGVEDSVFDFVVFVKVFGLGVVEDDKYFLLFGIGVISFCWVRYRGKIGFVVVLSVVDFVVVVIFGEGIIFDMVVCWVRELFEVLLDLVIFLGFKIFSILVWRLVCCLVIDWGFIVGWFGWVVVNFGEKVGVNGIMMNNKNIVDIL